MSVRIKEENFEEEVLKAELPVIIEFYSDSCIPCKQMAAVLGELEEEYDQRIKLTKVNVNFSAELADRFRVMASPTLLFFKDGKEAQRIIGLTKKPALKESIEKLLVNRLE